MDKKQFGERLTSLRVKKGISAREMSLNLGLNPGYINNIECGKAYPTMNNFFDICEYFCISPQEFFNLDCNNPELVKEFMSNVCKLSNEQLSCISFLVSEIIDK